MGTVRVFDLLQRRALVTRSKARDIGDAVDSALEDAGDYVTVDFAGVDGVSPSFVDELLFVFEKAVSDSGMEDMAFVLRNVPTRLSTKFEAIGRARQVKIVELEPGVWKIDR